MTAPDPTAADPPRIAVVGAGLAGLMCARTLADQGLVVRVFERSRGLGGRCGTRRDGPWAFDHGAQYFTSRDPRLAASMDDWRARGVVARWEGTVIIRERGGARSASTEPSATDRWVAVPGMTSLVSGWAEPLRSAGQIELETRITKIESDALNPAQWQLRTEALDGAQHVFSGFDAVLLATPPAQAHSLLENSKQSAAWMKPVEAVQMAPCWTLMLAFPQAMQPGLSTLGPQWNAARSTHHRIAWAARESSKPGRGMIERWTVQASAAWSQEHLHDDPARVQAKLHKAFAEITGIRAEPAHVDSQRWLYAKTVKPLGKSHLWDGKAGLGVCGDWCLGHRVEDAYVSGLELALAVL